MWGGSLFYAKLLFFHPYICSQSQSGFQGQFPYFLILFREVFEQDFHLQGLLCPIHSLSQQ